MAIMQQRIEPQVSSRTSGYPLWLLSGFWLSVVIAIAAVVRRLVAIINNSPNGAFPRRPQQTAVLDATFSSHAVLTAMHIIPAAIFVLLAAAVLLRRTAREWLQRLFFAFGAITAATAYAMTRYTVGGWIELSAVLVFNTWFLCSLSRAWWWRLRGEPARQREWMTRAAGILFGIATTRPVMGAFFATSQLTHLGPGQFFGFAFWIGFSINAVAVELWLRSKRRAELYDSGR
jgi:hypothetical protein